MNLSARIKNAKQKPNYVLNVNINFPIRSPHIESHRPVSGEFTLSPAHHNKKVKLQIPSARTTNQCQSRKFSYLGQTQNTMSFRHNNRKKTVKSAFTTEQISQLFNASKKSKSQIRSQAVSPNRKKLSTKISKNTSSNQISNKKLFVEQLFNQSQDNIIAYTSQSSQFQRTRKTAKNQSFISSSVNKSNFKFKSQSPLLQQQKGIIYQIRQFQKSAQIKKQHLNYQYLKQKVLVLASVKKIQRAWRNYKTKKIINSYSNNFSLKFTGKMKNQLFSPHQCDQGKILTVRSCGYNGKVNELKREGKKSLSQLYIKDQNISQIQQQYLNINENNSKLGIQQRKNQQYNKKKIKNIKEGSVKSAIVKFQMEQISKWQQLIKNIKQGKRLDQVLQKSFRRKLQLQKQLSNNLRDISSSDNSQISKKIKQLQNQPVNSQVKNIEQGAKNQEIFISQQVSSSSQNSEDQISKRSSPKVLKKQKKQKELHIKSQQQQQQQGATTQRRKKKLQYFENELRKIDNQYSQSNLSQSYKSQSSVQIPSPQFSKNITNLQKNSQQSQNMKLKRKLQAFNRVQMFSQERLQSKESQQEPRQHNFLYKCLQQLSPKIKDQQSPQEIKIKKQLHQQLKQEESCQLFPLSLNKKKLQSSDNHNEDRLQTFRKTNSSESNRFLYQQLENQRLKQLKKIKLTPQNRLDLTKKIQQELFYDLLLQFSQKQRLVHKIQKLYSSIKKKVQQQKPEGICTNLESIKDYLQNFVAFAFQQQTLSLIQGFNQPKGPSAHTLLKFLNQKKVRNETNFHIPVLSMSLFNQHWDYASQQIYFDAKFPNDPVKQQERVNHLKQITKMYFRAIFDGFNECLQPFRAYGLQGKPFSWKFNIKKRNDKLQLQQIKPLIRMGYRRLSQIAVIYCGLLFEDKKHSMTQKMIEQIQKQRLDTLVQLQLQDQHHKWMGFQIQKAQVLFKVSKEVYEELIYELCWQFQLLNLQLLDIKK